MAQYGSGQQRGPMGQTLMSGLNSVGQRGIPGGAGLSQAGLQRQAGSGVNMGSLGGASGGKITKSFPPAVDIGPHAGEQLLVACCLSLACLMLSLCNV